MQSIVYPINDALYINLTNRCLNDCAFCIRKKMRRFNNQHPLWLEHEPTAKEVLKAIGDPTKYRQIVFCGYGEPLVRLEIIKEIAKKLRTPHSAFAIPHSPFRIRIDTNGQANLFWGRNIVPELAGLIDHITVSLNAENAKKYNQICRSTYGNKAYPAIITFIEECKKHIPFVEASIVDLPLVDKEACHKLVKKLGVPLRLRPYYEEKYVR